MRKITFVLLLLVLSISISAQVPTEKIGAEMIKADFKMLRDTLEKHHAGLYRYKTKKQMDLLFDRCAKQLEEPMGVIEYANVIRYLISAIEDGHTSVALPQTVNKAIITQQKLFPLILYFIGNRAYVTCNSNGLAAGTEIKTIDGKSVDKLLKDLFKYMPSDGSITTGKYEEMNRGDSPFFYLYRLVYGEKASFRLKYISPEGKRGTTVLQADLFKNLQCKPIAPQVDKYLQLKYEHEGVAVLTVKSFLAERLESNKEHFEDFLKTAFKDLADKHVKNLIIDVRDNEGGNDNYGALLNSYLTDHPFPYFASIRTTSREFQPKEHNQLELQQAAENNFKGQVYVLINGKCFSTTADFCAVASNNQHIKFIGEETGGGYYGNTSGARMTLLLPHSQIKVNIPLWMYTNSVRQLRRKDRGTVPDYCVTPNIQEVIDRGDPQMEFALKLALEQ